jgi:hypothetical protein
MSSPMGRVADSWPREAQRVKNAGDLPPASPVEDHALMRRPISI